MTIFKVLLFPLSSFYAHIESAHKWIEMNLIFAFCCAEVTIKCYDVLAVQIGSEFNNSDDRILFRISGIGLLF